MARIRTVKPEFFRHEGLQDIETASPGQHCMLVFVGLWSVCDRAGRFEWRPRQLKLDILPFLDFDFTKTLAALASAGFVRQYTADGKQFGVIPSFGKHQRFSGKEAEEKPRYPEPPPETSEAAGKENIFPDAARGTGSEASGKHVPAQEREREGNKGKGKEGEGEGIGASPSSPQATSPPTAEIQSVVDRWNSLPGLFPKVLKLTDARRKAVRLRLGDEWWSANWTEAIDAIASSPFHGGNNDRGWVADFDYFVRSGTVEKLIERTRASPPPAADLDEMFPPLKIVD